MHSTDYGEVIPNFMSDLDGQRLFFLGTDKSGFANSYGKNVYWNLSALGNIDAAYDIFSVYETRVTARINWIFDELKKDVDLTANESYLADRTKAEWSATSSASDALWHQRIKFELIAEMMNKKTLDEAKQVVRKRYERMLKSLTEIEGGDVAELFLSNVARLYDPHSTYFSATSYEDFGIQMKLELIGIGAVLGVEEDYCVVKEIVPGGPADLSKQIKPNDKILTVAQANTEPVEIIGMKLRKIVAQIRGTKGTQVTLTIQPADATDPSTRKVVTLTRDLVKINSSRAHAAMFQAPRRRRLKNRCHARRGHPARPSAARPTAMTPKPTSPAPRKDGRRTSSRQLKTAGVQGPRARPPPQRRRLRSPRPSSLAGLFIAQGPVVAGQEFRHGEDPGRRRPLNNAVRAPTTVRSPCWSTASALIRLRNRATGALQKYRRGPLSSATTARRTAKELEVQTVLGDEEPRARSLAPARPSKPAR